MKTILCLRKLALVLGSWAFVLGALQAYAGVDGVDSSNYHLWSDIKGDTYSQRTHFSSGVAKMNARLDEQISELRARRAGMTTDTSDWDLAMKDVEECRSLFTDRMHTLANVTTPEAWDDAKEKIGEAWNRSQLAVDKMNSTRTS